MSKRRDQAPRVEEVTKIYLLNYKGTVLKIPDSMSKRLKRMYYSLSAARSSAKRMISETRKMYQKDEDYFGAMGTENMSIDMFEIIEYNMEEAQRFSI